MDLSQWALLYLKHQDLLKKEIENITQEKNSLLVQKKGVVERWLVQDTLVIDELGVQGVVVLNTKKNLKTLVSSWKHVKELSCKFVFANPKTNERWVLVPSHHARIADEKSLKTGFEAMANNISFVE